MPKGAPRIRSGNRRNIIGERVRQRRKELKLTQDALCARLALVTDGMADFIWNPDKQEIFKIERGIRSVTDLEVIALARALDCDPCWLLLGR